MLRRMLSTCRRAVVAAVILLCAPAVALAQTETTEYYGLDAIGSVRIVFDPNGTVLARLDYAPFGRELTPSPNAPDGKFAGLFRDGEAGLDYAQARSYQVRTGRFSAPDPVYAGLFEPQRWNRYSYGLNNSLVFVDPDGLNACTMSNGQPGFCTGVTATNPNPYNPSPYSFSVGMQMAAAWASVFGPGEYMEQARNRTGGTVISGGSPGQSGPTPVPNPNPNPPGPNPPGPNPPGPTPPREGCAAPALPQGSVRQNVQFIRGFAGAGRFSTPNPVFVVWTGMVSGWGEWNYKLQSTRETSYENAGNFNYGATGAALHIPSVVLRMGAGMASVAARPSRLWNGTTSWRDFFDAPEDVQWVNAGTQFTLRGCADE